MKTNLFEVGDRVLVKYTENNQLITTITEITKAGNYKTFIGFIIDNNGRIRGYGYTHIKKLSIEDANTLVKEWETEKEYRKKLNRIRKFYDWAKLSREHIDTIVTLIEDFECTKN